MNVQSYPLGQRYTENLRFILSYFYRIHSINKILGASWQKQWFLLKALAADQ